MRILLADDHGLMLAGARLALETEGCFEIVGEAHTGAQVMPLVSRLVPDVVLLDLHMPGIDGLGCLQRIRDRHPGVKVVMWSGSADPEHIQTAFKLGAYGFILKSIAPGDLGAAIREAVDGTAYHALGLPAIDDRTIAKEAGLTEREVEVVMAVSRGLSNKAIAAELWVTVQTVKFHLSSIYRKLGIHNRTEAATWAIGKGLTY
jgi:DNA-binding NarL/FixJ family response regulator